MRLPHLFLIIAVSVMLTLVGGEIARAQDAAPSVEEAQLPPKPQSHEEALVEAVRDGDLPRVEKLLVRPVAPETLSFLAHELAARPYTFYCGLDSNLPRVPWTRVRFLPVFQRLLRAITAVDGDKGDSGNSLLTAAASLGDLESVRCLVERGADVKYQESIQTVTVGYPEPTKIGGTSPLLEAVRSGIRNSDPDPGPLVAYLLREGADVNAVDAGGSTALMAASGIGNIGVVHALLAAGADANIRMENGQSCLDRARRNKHKKIAALLATVTDMNLTEASAVNDAGAVRRLLDGGASVNFADTESGETALMAAAQAGATDAAKVLLERGAAVHRTDRRGKNALHLAVEQGNVATVELLLDHKADPDASLVGKDDKGNTVPDEWRESEFPLILAIRGGYIPVVETLLRRGAGIDTPARKNTIASAFAMAAGRDGAGDTPPLKRADTIRLLDLLIGAGLSLRDDPIAVCAAQSATPELLKTLLDRGAPPDSWFVGKTDEEEHSALMATIQRVRLARDAQQEIGNLDGSLDDYVRSERDGKACFRLLLRRGARVDATTKVGTTAFTEAVVSHCFDMADELLRRGANLNAPDTKGRTALHRAVSENDYADESTLKYLLKHGANRSLRDKNGDTALMVARENKHAKATALLTGRD